MNTLHVSEPGTTLGKKSRRIVVEKGGVTLTQVRLTQLERVFLYGNVQISTQAMHLLMDQGIDIAFFTSGGKFKGRVNSEASKNVFLRIAQFDAWKDEEYRLAFSREIVKSKLANMAGLLTKYQYAYPELQLRTHIDKLNVSEQKVDDINEVSSLLGVEGNGSRVYFSAFSQLFRKDLVFQQRLKRPSPDPINALLSLGYVMITNEIAAMLEGISLDPHLGFYHEVQYGRKSLALDLVEEFRQPVVDALTIKLANLKVFTEKDFEMGDDNGVYLTPEAFKRYLGHYETKMQEKVSNATLAGLELSGSVSESYPSRNTGWRQLFFQQIKALKKSIEDGSGYAPYRMQATSGAPKIIRKD